MINNLNILKDKKFLEKLNEQGDVGYFDYQLADMFGWKLVAVRSEAGSLEKRELVHIIKTKKGWYICSLVEQKEIDALVGTKGKTGKKAK